uniref:C-type lectin domain-containing protein n=1 Tax=Pelusios castaneus TaxID=367368 RepID=A0A8C8RIC5_9SAUR
METNGNIKQKVNTHCSRLKKPLSPPSPSRLSQSCGKGYISYSAAFSSSAKKSDPCPADRLSLTAACLDGWVGYLGKCYYFSEAEADWAASQSHCSALNASLAGIDSRQEMDFLVRYKGLFDYWIGLHRELGQPWKWTNGTEFNHWFPVAGGEKCAFMNQNDISSSSCTREGHWICSKAVVKMGGKGK